MGEHLSGAPADQPLGRLAGTWRGTSGFRLMPTDEFHHGPATALVTTAAGGNVVVVSYTWNHPEDGPQEGVLFVGAPDDEQTVGAAWGDSWHQRPSILTLSGRGTEGRLEVTADYGGGWGWTIALEGDDPLRLTMHNVVPAEHATDEVAAGPYTVMVAELHREPPAAMT
jgi:hypothetical protein